MFVPFALYSLAAFLDVRYRRVPNILWLVVAAYGVWSGVTLGAVVGGVYLGSAGYYSWTKGEIGGADVKGMGLLPFAFPVHWPMAITITVLLTGVVFLFNHRQEVPFFVPMLAGIAAALLL